MAIVKKLGWSGSGNIGGLQVLVTSGNFATEYNPSYIQYISTPRNVNSRSRVTYADGTITSNGSIAFDLTAENISLISTSCLLRRSYSFDVYLEDGENSYRLDGCYATSVSVTGSVGGLLNVSLSFTSNKEFKIGITGSAYVRDQIPYAYWYSGDATIPVREWSFTFNQAVQHMFLNQYSSGTEGRKWAKYLRIGLIDATLDVTTFEQVMNQKTIKIATKSVSLSGNTKTDGYSFNGQTDLGTFSHSFETAATLNDGPTWQVISVT